VVFGEHSNIANLGGGVFNECYALASITLPGKLTIVEKLAFNKCTSLELVVCNKTLKTIDECVFQLCSKLEDVQFASSSISFGGRVFSARDRLIELADAAGFPSKTTATFDNSDEEVNAGRGLVRYLIDRFERSEGRTSSARPSVKKIIVENEVENQLRSEELRERLKDESLADGSVELYLRCSNLTAIGWGEKENDLARPFAMINSLVLVDLSGCPKLKHLISCSFIFCHGLEHRYLQR